MPRPQRETTTFLNVDLELYSRFNLAPLVAAMGRRVHVLYQGRHRQTYEAHLEVAARVETADVAIRRFVSLINSLSGEARALWDTARRRDFSIGIRAAMEPSAYDVAIEQETVAAVAALKARIVVTVYAPEMAKPWPPAASTRAQAG